MSKAKQFLLAVRIAFAIWGVKRAISKQEKAMRERRLREQRLREAEKKRDDHGG